MIEHNVQFSMLILFYFRSRITVQVLSIRGHMIDFLVSY